ncbi:MAG: putative oxidoreductase yvaG [Actinoallomurus sp.]|nr:putative oxidoreductase yvaG [Actinoallomurus sp.]
MAQELARTGVTVNSVLPGPTRTSGVEAFVAGRVGADLPFEEAERRFIAEERPSSLLGRLARRSRQPRALCRLRGRLATTGAALRADGGVIPTLIP